MKPIRFPRTQLVQHYPVDRCLSRSPSLPKPLLLGGRLSIDWQELVETIQVSHPNASRNPITRLRRSLIPSALLPW
jgi:hypothetical protein